MAKTRYEIFKEWKIRTKNRAIEAFGGKCGICGYNKCTRALEFHHINPKEKEFGFSGYRKNNWMLLVKELKKCVCICSNCHREIHEGLINIPKNIEFFDDKFITYESTKYKIIYDNCPICNEKKDDRFKYCSPKCSSVGQQRINWNKYNLEEMIMYMPMTHIAKEVGVCDNAVRKRLKKLGLPSKRKEIVEYINTHRNVDQLVESSA